MAHRVRCSNGRLDGTSKPAHIFKCAVSQVHLRHLYVAVESNDGRPLPIEPGENIPDGCQPSSWPSWWSKLQPPSTNPRRQEETQLTEDDDVASDRRPTPDVADKLPDSVRILGHVPEDVLFQIC